MSFTRALPAPPYVDPPAGPKAIPPVAVTDLAARSLYVHFPFCESKCHYCDFYSIGREKTGENDPLTFEAALLEESGHWAEGGLASELDTLFFGGGTPSMTPPSAMRRALEPLRIEERLTPSTEWTMEANPSSIRLTALQELRGWGVNRISMGVQSLDNAKLMKMGRVHSSDDVYRALDTVFSAGFTRVSVDLLCGVPGQTTEELAATIARLITYPIDHLSCYLLTLVKGHSMYRQLPGEDIQLEHLLLIDRELVAAGFRHYEISNFARNGEPARHNMAYWTGKSYLGLGPSAHSFDSVKQMRWKNASTLHGYADHLRKGRLPIDSGEILNQDQQSLENWMLSLRLDDGVEKTRFVPEWRAARLRKLKHEGLIEDHPSRADRVRLTARGYAMSDAIIGAFA